MPIYGGSTTPIGIFGGHFETNIFDKLAAPLINHAADTLDLSYWVFAGRL